MQILPLNNDIFDRIFHFLPSLDALVSLASTSKTFYDVFSRHSNSIKLAVAYNLVGPALPQALSVVRLREAGDSRASILLDSVGMSTNLTTSEMRDLKRVVDIVQGLENIFSISHKDRSSAESVLTSAESNRFCKAVYRIMLFCQVFSVERYRDEDLNRIDLPQHLQEDAATRDERLKKEREARRVLVDQLCPTLDDLAELHVVSNFLREVMELCNVSVQFMMVPIEYGLAAGPEALLHTYTKKAPASRLMHVVAGWFGTWGRLESLDGYLSIPVRDIWVSRDAGELVEDDRQWDLILDTVNGEDDVCEQCGFSDGMKLWGEPNWEYVPGVSRISEHQLLELVPELPSHAVKKLSKKLEEDGLPALLSELFSEKESEFDTWDKHDWICRECLDSFIKEHLVLWLVYH